MTTLLVGEGDESFGTGEGRFVVAAAECQVVDVGIRGGVVPQAVGADQQHAGKFERECLHLGSDVVAIGAEPARNRMSSFVGIDGGPVKLAQVFLFDCP